jgi:hypothetical protein
LSQRLGCPKPDRKIVGMLQPSLNTLYLFWSSLLKSRRSCPSDGCERRSQPRAPSFHCEARKHGSPGLTLVVPSLWILVLVVDWTDAVETDKAGHERTGDRERSDTKKHRTGAFSSGLGFVMCFAVPVTAVRRASPVLTVRH